MANVNVNVNITECWYYGVPHGSSVVYATDAPVIYTGAYGDSQSTGITRIRFTTPPFISDETLITLRVNCMPSTQYQSGSSCMRISSKAYDEGEITDVFGYGSDDFHEELKNNSLGQYFVNEDRTSFIAENISLQKNTTYYLYFARVGFSSFNRYEASSVSIQLQCSELQTLTTPEILTSSQIVKPKSNISFSWSASISSGEGLSNSVSKYRVFIKVGSSNWTQKAETTSTTYSYSTSGLSRGTIIKAKIQAISLYDQYKDNLNYAEYLENCNVEGSEKQIGSINNLPLAPTSSSDNYIVGGETSIDITLTPGADNDGQTQTTYYELGTSGKTKATNNKISLTLSKLRELGISETGDYTLKAYTYDGLEYSSNTKSITITAKFAPVIKTDTLEYLETTVAGRTGGSVLNSIIIKFKLDYNFTSGLTALVQANEKTVSEITFNFTKEEKEIIIYTKDIINLDNIGSTFNIKFKISNEGGDSEEFILKDSSGITKEFITPALLTVTDFNITNDELDSASVSISNYFKEKIWASCNFNTQNSDIENRPAIKTVHIIVTESGEDPQIVYGKLMLSQDDYYNKSGSVKKTYIYPVTFGLQVVDEIGQKVVISSDQEFYKVQSPNYPTGSMCDISSTSFNPNKTEDLIFTHPFAFNENTSISAKYEYDYILQVGNKEIQIDNSYYTPEKNFSSSTITVTFNDDFKTKLIAEFDNTSNFEEDTSIRVIIKDTIFGGEYEPTLPETNSFSLTLITAPSWSDGASLEILHDYSKETILTSEIIKKSTKINISKNFNNQTQIFNPGEGIILKFPEPIDPNGGTFSFNIYYRNRYLLESDLFPFNFNTCYKIKIQSNEIFSMDDGEGNNYYYYRISAPANTKGNNFRYYGISAIDNTNNESSVLYFQNTNYDENSCICCARTTSSVIEISNFISDLEYKNNPEDNAEKEKIKLNFDLKIVDTGGSITRESDNEDFQQEYYNTYPNLDRFSTADLDSRRIKVTISNNSSLEDDGQTKTAIEQYNFVSSSEEDYIYSDNIFIFEKPTWGRIYIKIALEITPEKPSDSAAYLSSNLYLTDVFSAMPTVAHRANRVGINVTEVDDENVLVVSTYKNHKKIILTNNPDTTIEDVEGLVKIIIDLEGGTITGAVINGGSW